MMKMDLKALRGDRGHKCLVFTGFFARFLML